MRIVLTIFLVSLLHLQGETGTITGTVQIPKTKKTEIPLGKYRGKISGKVAPPSPNVAAVWLEGPNLTAPSKSSRVVLAQKNYQFSEPLLVVAKGTTITFPNYDPDFHNIYSLSKPKRFDLGRYKAEEKDIPSVTFDKLGFIALRCEIHDHMKANIIVVDTPHFITTDANGKFTLKNIPPGNYTLHAQTDKKHKWKTSITVQARKTTTVKFPAK